MAKKTEADVQQLALEQKEREQAQKVYDWVMTQLGFPSQFQRTDVHHVGPNCWRVNVRINNEDGTELIGMWKSKISDSFYVRRGLSGDYEADPAIKRKYKSLSKTESL